MCSETATTSTSTIGSGLSFGAIYRMAKKIKKVVRPVEEAKIDEEKVEKKVLKRKMEEEKPMEVKKARMEDLEDGEIIDSDDEDKENMPKPLMEIEFEDARVLNDPNDEEEYFRKLGALFHGQTYIVKVRK